MAVGIGKRVQMGAESTFSVKAEPSLDISYLSATIKETPNKEAEESLNIAKAVAGLDITSISVAGELELVMKPEIIGRVFAYTMGKEATPTLKDGTTAVYEHVITGMDITDVQKSETITIDKGVAIRAYKGCLADTLSLSARAKETVKGKLSIKGNSAESGTINTSLPIASKKSFRFVNGSCSFDGVANGTITSVDWSYSNSLTDDDFNFGSGLYSVKHLHTEKKIELTLTAEYDATTEAIIQDNLLNNDYLAIVLNFESPELIETSEKYKIKIEMPKVCITEAPDEISGKEKIRLNIKGVATGNGGVEPVTVTVTDSKATKYY